MSGTVSDQPPIASRATFAPPPPRGKGRAFALALLAHVLLVLALAWGLRWKKEAQDQAVEAELWSAIAHTAAPRAASVQPPPPPVTPPSPAPQPKPVPPQVNDDSARQAELALEQQKKRQEAQRQAEQARLQAQLQKQAAAKAAEAAQKAAEQKAAAAKAAEQKAQADRQAKADAAARQARLRQLTALASADAAGTTNTTVSGQGKTAGGNAPRDTGPSAGYEAKVRARVYPNITYLDLSTISGNPEADVEVITKSDGTIVERRLVQSSGVPSWDNAVLRAIDKTQALPRDVDGRVPSPIIIGFRPH